MATEVLGLVLLSEPDVLGVLPTRREWHRFGVRVHEVSGSIRALKGSDNDGIRNRSDNSNFRNS